MTLNSDSQFPTLCRHYFSALLVAILTAVLFLPPLANGHAVNSTRELGDRLFPEEGCLLFDEGLLQDRQMSGPTYGTKVEYDVFPLEDCVKEVAQQIVSGIVASLRSDGGELDFGDSLVDLGVLVRNNVEQSTIQDDPYWNYYLSCDQWKVVFNADPDYSRTNEIASSQSSGRDAEDQAELEHLITKLKQFYLGIEFVVIEQVKTQQIVNPFKSSLVNRWDHWSPFTELLGLRETGLFGFWANLGNRIEMASRWVFGVRCASKIGNQFLESTHPPVQH